MQERGGQEEFGPYELVANWPQPLPDGPDGVKHDGWTWGSVGAVYAETPDRIWIAQRGELPLPSGAKPWTPYSMLQSRRGNATGNDDGLGATCEPTEKRGWERRYHHVIFVVDRNGKLVQWWPQHDKLFEMPCGRGPHKIKMSPYDREKHVWVIDDQLHVIHKFTYDGKLVMTLGTKGKSGRDGGNALRPADRHRLAARRDVLHQRRVRRHARGEVRQGRQVPDGLGLRSEGSEQPGSERVEHRPQHRDQQRPPALRRGSRPPAHSRSSTRTASSSTCGPPACGHQPYAHLITTDQFLWVSDGGTNRILKYDLNGKYLYGWGGPGGQPGSVRRPAFDHDRSGRQPLSRRSLQRPRAEVPSEEGRRSGEARGPGGALVPELQ